MIAKGLIYLAITYFAINVAAFDSSSSQNVAVYWGQNSAGSQEALSTYCDSDSVDIVILSFLYGFPDLALNFANACTDSFSDGLLHCPTIAEDIKSCQAGGKKILLSLGGATGSYGFTSDSEAKEFATTLWNKFGGGSDDERPFDDAVVDGFDFDIENLNQVGYAALASALRSSFEKDDSKDYYLSAAPQCPYPDQSVGDLLENASIDFAFIQFYNNYCNLGTNFNWDTWLDYATNTSPNKNIKLYLGLPASQSAAGSGYVAASGVQEYVDKIKSDSHFGGISLWDASAAWANTDNGDTFADQMKSLLDTSSSATSSSSTSSKARSTTLSSSTLSATSRATTSSITSSSTSSSSTLISTTSTGSTISKATSSKSSASSGTTSTTTSSTTSSTTPIKSSSDNSQVKNSLLSTSSVPTTLSTVHAKEPTTEQTGGSQESDATTSHENSSELKSQTTKTTYSTSSGFGDNSHESLSTSKPSSGSGDTRNTQTKIRRYHTRIRC
ncbi:uncharacterized protein PRCAT00001074001 [Priceomyces carsonii]|uniref:uncharacterized protein n=1 Tax=Priceomyces carsonii TaxID=28549 RepID=UPI002ED927BA|nr:unnamed protein product [Priceomyces carsonii]